MTGSWSDTTPKTAHRKGDRCRVAASVRASSFHKEFSDFCTCEITLMVVQLAVCTCEAVGLKSILSRKIKKILHFRKLAMQTQVARISTANISLSKQQRYIYVFVRFSW